jgi:hypothetical protein
MAAIAQGDSTAAVRELDRFDRVLADVPTARPGGRLRLRARATIRSVVNSLTHHATYFDARVPT